MALCCQAVTSLVIKSYYRVYHDAIMLKQKNNDVHSLLTFLVKEIESCGLRVRPNIYLPQMCGGRFIGFNYVDMVIEDQVALAIMNKNSMPLQQIQALRIFLTHGNLSIGLLVSFNHNHPDFRQVENPAISTIRFMG